MDQGHSDGTGPGDVSGTGPGDVSGSGPGAAPAQARRRAPMALVTWAFVVLVLLIVAVLLVLKITQGSTTVAAPPVAPASAVVVQGATSVPPAVFDAVGGPSSPSPGPTILSGQPSLTIDGLPAVVYVGAEFCPYCAAERWVLVVALSRFGTFSHLGATSSSPDEVFPRTATFSFDGSSYRSRYLSFSAVEEYADRASTTAPAGFPRLHPLTSLQQGLLRHYDTSSYTSQAGALPFVDVDNRLLVVGASVGFSPGVLAHDSMSQIASALAQPSDEVSRAILSQANGLTAAICASTGERPESVCRSRGVVAGGETLGIG